MSIVAIGCNHRSTPLAKLERMTVASDDMGKVLSGLGDADHLSEVVVLSTCNRIEVYAFAERFHGGYQDVREFLARHAGLAPEDVADHLYAHHDAEAVRHLFAVAAGLDSAVVGEHEILGQIRDAWERARDEGTVGSSLGGLFRHAVETGKRARSETSIGRGIASVSQAAVALADDRVEGGIAGRTVLVIGAGDMAEGTVKTLAAAGAGDVFVANRTWERAVSLAEACDGQPVPLDRLADALERVDVLVTTTGAQDLILEAADVDALVDRREAPLCIVDVAVPRDVDPTARRIPGVTLLDMDDIGAFIDEGLGSRNAEVASVRSIVDGEVERYQSMVSAREVAPLISDLRSAAEATRVAELERYAAKLADLDPAERDAVEALTKGIVNKLLHEPSVRLKGAAGRARGERLAESLRDLFDL
ncbi:MAG: glutamyl-tRNA reductase [Actinomycetota bacterium]